MKQLFKTFFQNIKLWGWYEWLKYLLAGFLFVFACVMFFGVLYMEIHEAGIGMMFLTMIAASLFILPTLATSWLIVKDYRLPYVLLVIFGALGIYWSLQGLGVYYDNYPRFFDVVDIVFMIASIICFCKITFDKDVREKKDQSSLSNISIIVACGYLVMLFLGMAISKYIPDDDDWKFERAKECMETRVAKGYPRDFAREYCLGPGEYCDRTYSKDCNPEIYCCFATIEEDKKWNYLDYDEKGNKK